MDLFINRKTHPVMFQIKRGKYNKDFCWQNVRNKRTGRLKQEMDTSGWKHTRTRETEDRQCRLILVNSKLSWKAGIKTRHYLTPSLSVCATTCCCWDLSCTVLFSTRIMCLHVEAIFFPFHPPPSSHTHIVYRNVVVRIWHGRASVNVI